MSLVFRYVNTTGTNRFNVDLGNAIVRLGSITSGFIERAELGEPGNGGIEFDDAAGTLTVLGLQFLKVAENAIASGSDVIFNGYINDRKYSRGDGSRGSLRTGAARMISVDIADFNQIITMRKVRDGDRPAESAHVRLAWLLALGNCPVHDYGYVRYPGHAMDKNDYTGNTFKDVLADIAAAVSYNFFAQYDQSHDNIGLHFYDPNSTIYTTTARVSNVLGDIDQSTTFECWDVEMTRSPSRIASGVDVAYNGGRYYELRLSTADTYAKFDQSAPVASVKTLAKAQAIADAFLNQSDTEDDRITLKAKIPAAHVNDIRAGHRMSAKFSHLANEGYGGFTDYRVMSRTVLQDEEDDSQYNVALELTPLAASAEQCSVQAVNYLNSTVDGTVQVTNTPSGSRLYNSTFGSSGDNVASGTEGLVYYLSSGGGGPRSRPIPNGTAGQAGGWSFRDYGAVKAGMPNGHADGGLGGGSGLTGVKIQIMVVGPGTMTIWATSTATAGWHLYKIDMVTPLIPNSDIATEISSGSLSFPSTTITVPNDGACLHYVLVTDLNTPLPNALYFGGWDWTAS